MPFLETFVMIDQRPTAENLNALIYTGFLLRFPQTPPKAVDKQRRRVSSSHDRKPPEVPPFTQRVRQSSVND